MGRNRTWELLGVRSGGGLGERVREADFSRPVGEPGFVLSPFCPHKAQAPSPGLDPDPPSHLRFLSFGHVCSECGGHFPQLHCQ